MINWVFGIRSVCHCAMVTQCHGYPGFAHFGFILPVFKYDLKYKVCMLLIGLTDTLTINNQNYYKLGDPVFCIFAFHK